MNIPQTLVDMPPLLLSFTARVLGALLILLVAWAISSWTRRVLRRGLKGTRADLTLVKFVSNTARWLILGLGLVGCLSLFGIESTSFAAVLGAAGLAIGLALQGSLGHLASGLMLLLLRPFKTGDVVKIAGHIGTVDEIDLFVTTLDTADKRRLVIPNTKVFSDVIENLSHHDVRRIDLDFVCAYAADIEKTRGVLENVLRTVPGVQTEPAAQVVLIDVRPTEIQWQLRAYVAAAELGACKETLLFVLKSHVDAAKIPVARPALDVAMRAPLGEPTAPAGTPSEATPL